MFTIKEHRLVYFKSCENCGCRVYSLGCVNCDEVHYIAQQEMNTARPEEYEQYADHSPQ